MFDIRVSRYELGAGRAGVFPALSVALTSSLESGSISCKVSERVVDQLPPVVELQADYWDGAGWVEAPNLRTVLLADGIDDKDPAGIRSLESVWLFQFFLTMLQVFDPPDLDSLVDGKRMFNSATPGAIMKTLLDEGLAEGWGTDPAWSAPLAYDFDADVDSAGVPWPQQLSIGYDPGTDAWTILTNLIDQGVVSVGSDARTLHLWGADRGVDRSVGDAPVRLGTAASSLPIKRDLSKLTNTAVVRGEGGFRLRLDATTYVPGLGRLFTTINQGGVSDPGTATLLAQRTLDQGAQAREQISVTGPAASATWFPWIHYGLGDWVSARVKGAWRAVRAVEFVISKDDKGAVVLSPVLNDRFIELTARLAKRTQGISGGASAGGSGAVPSTEDRRRPKPPTGLTASSTGYWWEGTALSQLTAAWDAVTQGENNVAIEVGDYELQAAPQGTSDWRVLTSTESTTVDWSPFEPGSSWQVRVLAISKAGVPGLPSASVLVVMQSPIFSLDQPTAPVLSSSSGIIQVVWDGLFATEPPSVAPNYFMQMNVEASENEAGPYSLIGTLVTGSQRASFIGDSVGATVWIRFTPVDKLGRPGAPSEPSMVEVLGIDGGDIVAGTVTANSIAAGSIEVQHLAAGLGSALDISSNESVNIIVGQVEAVAGDLADTNAAQQATAAELQDMRTYYQFGPTELTIGRPDSPVSFALTNEGAEIRESGVAVSSWQSGRFMSASVVTDQLDLGNHKVEAFGTDGTVVRVV